MGRMALQLVRSLSVAIILIVGVACGNTASENAATPTRRSADRLEGTKAGDEARSPQATASRPKVVASGGRPRTTNTRRASLLDEISPSRAARAPATDAEATGVFACDPLIVDAREDIVNPSPANDDAAIDILESSITFDASANTLTLRHVLEDIPDAPLPNEELLYDFEFSLEGTTYHAMAFVGPQTDGEWLFHIVRDDRTEPASKPIQHRLMYTPGRVDRRADTVKLVIDIGEFNRAERRVSKEEGLEPAAELRPGSTLENNVLSAYPRWYGPGPFDKATGCNYVVPER